MSKLAQELTDRMACLDIELRKARDVCMDAAEAVRKAEEAHNDVIRRKQELLAEFAKKLD